MSAFANWTNYLERRLGVVMVTLFTLVALLAGWRVMTHFHKSAMLAAGNQTFTLQVADTPQAREEGLSNRTSLPKNQGMLFVFDSPNTECFWMKDMNFPLDIVWLNAAKQVAHLEQNVTPGTYPKAFCPSVLTKYVIELNAGTVGRIDLHQGQTLKF